MVVLQGHKPYAPAVHPAVVQGGYISSPRSGLNMSGIPAVPLSAVWRQVWLAQHDRLHETKSKSYPIDRALAFISLPKLIV